MNEKLQNDLNKLIPNLNASINADDLKRHSIDALNPNRVFQATKELTTLPLIVVRPKNTYEVATVVRFASKEGVPIVPWGGGTGVMGAAASIESGIVLDLKFLIK